MFWTTWFKLSSLKDHTSSDFIFPGFSKSPHSHRGLHSHALPTAGPPCPPQTWFFFPSITLFLSPISNTLIHNNNPPPPPPFPNALNCSTLQHMCFQFAFLLSRVEAPQTPPFFFAFTHPHLSSHKRVYNVKCAFWLFANLDRLN